MSGGDPCKDVKTAQNLTCVNGKESRVSFFVPKLKGKEKVKIQNGKVANEKWEGHIEKPNALAGYAKMKFLGRTPPAAGLSGIASRLATLSVTIEMASGDKQFDACFLLDAPIPDGSLGPLRRFIKWLFRL